eukprot:229602-Pyramimonas_sp.AAC.1
MQDFLGHLRRQKPDAQSSLSCARYNRVEIPWVFWETRRVLEPPKAPGKQETLRGNSGAQWMWGRRAWPWGWRP